MAFHPRRRQWSTYAGLNPLRTYTAILSELTHALSPRVLDIGCGFNTPTLSKLTGFRVGVDLVQTDAFVPATGVSVLKASGEQLPFSSGVFDLACCRSVLEHIEHPDALFAEVYRTLRPGGMFVFATPNRWDYVSVASSLVPNRWHPRLVHSLTGRAEKKTFPTLYRANTISALRKLAQGAGLQVESLELCRQHPHYLRRNVVLYSLGVAFEHLVQKPVPSLRPWILGVLKRP